MADEVNLEVPKHLWPKGVTRALATVLRELGDKHGQIVIAAQMSKGVIMMKGPEENIEEAKPELRSILAAHFPDVDIGTVFGDAMEVEAPPINVPTTTPAGEPAPLEEKEAESDAGNKQAGVWMFKPRKHIFPQDLVYQCMKTKSSLLAISKHTGTLFSRDPLNLVSLQSRRYVPIERCLISLFAKMETRTSLSLKTLSKFDARRQHSTGRRSADV